MKAKIIGLLLLLFLAGSVSAQESSIPAAFIDVGLGARASALGGAYTGLANDVDALFWNPAGLAELTEKQASFNFAKVFGLISYNMASYGMPLKYGDAQHGAGIAIVSSGDEALRELTFMVGYGRVVGPVSVGLNLKYRRASFGNNTLNRDDYAVFSDDEYNLGVLNQVNGTANGFGFDLGVMYKLEERIKLGLMVRDAAAPVFWDSKVKNPNAQAKGKYTESVPMEMIIGTSFIVSPEFLVTADYQPAFSKEVFNKIRGGAELRLWKFLFIRAGLENVVNSLEDEKYTFGFGFNMKIKSYRFFFDFTRLIQELDNSNRISLGFYF